ncbi:GGDEF domain-containing protein [Asanoa sp. WMMD1127]|uniref:GGDEF domain-containing protein n=1 Tax=Asanoa sp. WMMD1127 TaxID=3016107 RepID=UPI002416D746|nr:GGDEF domain-containing protein [Asanoa sp. WMMD1127]MDG4827124.1 GGDEF domain-containing protein [Asanoa sp. WMMD1127]
MTTGRTQRGLAMADAGLWRGSAWAFLGVEGALVLATAAGAAPVLGAVAAVAAFLVAAVILVVRQPPRVAAWASLTVASGSVAFSRVYGVVAGPSILGGRTLAGGDIRALVLYPALAIGLILLGGTGSLTDTLDASVVILGVFVLLWLFLLHGNMVPTGTRLAVSALRPVGISVVLGALVRLLFVVRPRAPALRLVAVGVLLALVGALGLVARTVGYDVDSRLFGGGIFATAYAILVATALLHPSAGAAPERRGAPAARLSRGRAALFVALTLLGPLAWVLAVAFGEFDPGSPEDFGPPVLAAAVIALLLLWRLSLLARVADRRAGDLAEAVGELQELQAELAHRAAHDPLTGLLNRSVLTERLAALPRGRSHALLLVDLDGFKEINDSLGHPTGDELLVAVGRRLTAVAAREATLVRLGGDEFAVLLPDTDEGAALAVGATICARLRAPYPSTHGELRVSASVGVTAGPLATRGSGDLLREADLALYAAKAAGKDRVAAYRPTLAPPGLRVKPR